MEKHKTCSFFGHRNTKLTKQLEEKLKNTIEDLILNKNVLIFLFGSRSAFNDFCLSIVTKLKEKYPNIKRIGYPCKSESFAIESDKEKWIQIYQQVHPLFVDEEYEYKTKYTANKASYYIRNQAMIDNSNYCVFYFNNDYQPPQRKHSKNAINFYQPKSGTKLAFNYAKNNKKIIINLFERM